MVSLGNLEAFGKPIIHKEKAGSISLFRFTFNLVVFAGDLIIKNLALGVAKGIPMYSNKT